MHGLRQHQANGEIVATSSSGSNYLGVLDGAPFAQRSGDTFKFVDGRVGRLGGTVVYVMDANGTDVATYWFEDAIDQSGEK